MRPGEAGVLVQLGLLDPDGLPIAGAENARKVLDVSLPTNTLMTASQYDAWPTVTSLR